MDVPTDGSAWQPDRRRMGRGAGYDPRHQSGEHRRRRGRIQLRRPAATERAIAAARSAFANWSMSGIQQRFDILDRIGTEILERKEELGTLLSREEGKTLTEGIGEVARAGSIFKFFAGEALRLVARRCHRCTGIQVEMSREPVGVIGLITPWNFPIAIPAWKTAPALAYGNCVVIKPAELTPGVAWHMADIIAGPVCRTASSTWSSVAARWWARRC